jgi:hypothetical protein
MLLAVKHISHHQINLQGLLRICDILETVLANLAGEATVSVIVPCSRRRRMRVRSSLPVFTVFLLAVLLLSSCSVIAKKPAPTQLSDIEYTQAAETISAELTLKAPQATPTVLEQVVQAATSTLPPTNTPAPTETLPPTSTPLPTDTPEPTETPTPAIPSDTPTATFTPEPEYTLLFQDDLKSGFWTTDKTDAYRMQYTMGGYMISNKTKQDIIYSVHDVPLGDVRVQVTGKRISGPMDGYYGLICNFVNGSNFYFLGIGVDGWYGIGIKQTGQLRFLKEGMDKSGAIKLGDMENDLRAECGQGVLSLWVNGVQLTAVTDQTLAAGSTGIGVGNRDTAGTEVLFQDFSLFTQK